MRNRHKDPPAPGAPALALTSTPAPAVPATQYRLTADFTCRDHRHVAFYYAGRVFSNAYLIEILRAQNAPLEPVPC